MDALCLYNLMQTRVAIFYFLNISCVKCNLRKLVAQNATPRPSVRIEHQVASLIVTKGLAWS